MAEQRSLTCGRGFMVKMAVAEVPVAFHLDHGGIGTLSEALGRLLFRMFDGSQLSSKRTSASLGRL